MSRSIQPPDLEKFMFEQIQSFKDKCAVYENVVTELNNYREFDIIFEPATAFRDAYDRSGLEASTNKVNITKIWHLTEALVDESAGVNANITREKALVIGARRHLESEHEKLILYTIKNDPTQQAALGEDVGNLQKIQAFLWIFLKQDGVLDFDASDAIMQPAVNTTWQQIYFCLRTGYHEEAINVCAANPADTHQFASQLHEWIHTGGMVSQETAAAASSECEDLLRTVNLISRPELVKKFLLFAIISGSREQVDWFRKEDLKAFFNTVDEVMWFKLSAVRNCTCDGAASPVTSNSGLVVPYTLHDLQLRLNKVKPSSYKKHPLVYAYLLLLSTQFLPAMICMSQKTARDDGFIIDAVHVLIALADQGLLSDDDISEASKLIRHYGSALLHSDNLAAALEYYVQAAYTMSGGMLSWSEGEETGRVRQRQRLLKQLLAKLLLHDGGALLLLGTPDAGEEGEIWRFLKDTTAQEQFLAEATLHCENAGLLENVSNYITYISGATSSSTSDDSIKPGRKALAKAEFLTNKGKCLFCKHETKFKEFRRYVNHQLINHRKQYCRGSMA
ncbi:hypothetical protein MKW92_026370 [Papaver armeniacum]|nr:hypothetical protein MKW92_026370 [Papaver armeniacum]